MNKEYFEDLGYFNLIEIEGRGWCGLFQFIFTVGLCYGLTEYSYEGRYCFKDFSSAKAALNGWAEEQKWKGLCDPGEEWIKHKGKIQYSNPTPK